MAVGSPGTPLQPALNWDAPAAVPVTLLLEVKETARQLAEFSDSFDLLMFKKTWRLFKRVNKASPHYFGVIKREGRPRPPKRRRRF